MAADLSVVPITWAGSPVVGGGVTVLHCLPGDENALIGAFKTFYTSIRSLFPDSLQWTFPTSGDAINTATGKREGTWSATAVSAVSGFGGVVWVNGVGTRVKWTTSGVVNGNTVVGSTFLVPLISGSYEGAGNITSSAISTLSTAANVIAGLTPLLRVYSRPTDSRTGSSHVVVAAQVPDLVSWLRGRRT